MSGSPAKLHQELCGCLSTDAPEVIGGSHDKEGDGTEWFSCMSDSDDLNIPRLELDSDDPNRPYSLEIGRRLELDEKVPVDVFLCEICSSLTVNPACVRCDIVLCDMCLFHRDAHCMCDIQALRSWPRTILVPEKA
jgi:hypothetical protein